MLLTLEKEANRLRYQIPAPERKHKVRGRQDSMASTNTVHTSVCACNMLQ